MKDDTKEAIQVCMAFLFAVLVLWWIGSFLYHTFSTGYAKYEQRSAQEARERDFTRTMMGERMILNAWKAIRL